MNVKTLLGNRVHLAPLVLIEHTDSAITIPDAFNDPRPFNQYRVLAVGPGKRNRKGVMIAPEVQQGDYVMFKEDFDNITLEDGTKIVAANQILARWRY